MPRTSPSQTPDTKRPWHAPTLTVIGGASTLGGTRLNHVTETGGGCMLHTNTRNCLGGSMIVTSPQSVYDLALQGPS